MMTALCVARLTLAGGATFDDVARFENVFFELLGASATSRFRGMDGNWLLQAFFDQRPKPRAVAELLAPVFEEVGLPQTETAMEEVEQRDWLALNRKDFPPIAAGRFWIAGDHVEGRAPAASVELRVGAAQAFGTGLHPSTVGCLHALESICARSRMRRRRFLDMGCGSAILALAAVKMRPGFRGIAVDNDLMAVQVARRNARVNRVAPGRLRTHLANGYASRQVRAGAPYGLILANILPAPLRAMAVAQLRALAPDGWLVLSGITDRHAAMVERCYRARGASSAGRVEIGGWTTLIMRHARQGGMRLAAGYH